MRKQSMDPLVRNCLMHTPPKAQAVIKALIRELERLHHVHEEQIELAMIGRLRKAPQSDLPASESLPDVRVIRRGRRLLEMSGDFKKHPLWRPLPTIKR